MPFCVPSSSVTSKPDNLYSKTSKDEKWFPLETSSSVNLARIKNKSDFNMSMLNNDDNSNNHLDLLTKPRPFSYAADHVGLSEHINHCLSDRRRSGSESKANTNNKIDDIVANNLSNSYNRLTEKDLEPLNSNKNKVINEDHQKLSASTHFITIDNDLFDDDKARKSNLLAVELPSDSQSLSQNQNLTSISRSAKAFQHSSNNYQKNLVDKDGSVINKHKDCYSGSNIALPLVDYYSSGNHHVSFIDCTNQNSNSTEKLCPHSSSSSSKLSPKSSNCIFMNIARFPWLSIWLGVFMIAEIIAFCVISSGFVSSSLVQLQRTLPPNETFPLNQIRAFSSAVLSLVSLLQVIAIIGHMLIASAVARNQSTLINKIEQNCKQHTDYIQNNNQSNSSHYSICVNDKPNITTNIYNSRNGTSKNSKRQLLKYICFRCIQLCIIFFFFLLFLLWLLISLLSFGLLVLGVVVPYIVFSCGQDTLPNVVQDIIIFRKSNEIDYSSVQSLFMRLCLSTNGGQQNCEAFQQMACSLRTEWTTSLPIIFGCCILLVITIVLTLCCQSLNFGCSSHHLVNKVKLAYLRTLQRNNKCKAMMLNREVDLVDDISLKNKVKSADNNNKHSVNEFQSSNRDCCVVGGSQSQLLLAKILAEQKDSGSDINPALLL